MNNNNNNIDRYHFLLDSGVRGTYLHDRGQLGFVKVILQCGLSKVALEHLILHAADEKRAPMVVLLQVLVLALDRRVHDQLGVA